MFVQKIIDVGYIIVLYDPPLFININFQIRQTGFFLRRRLLRRRLVFFGHLVGNI